MPPFDSPTTTCWRKPVTRGVRRSVRPARHRVARLRDDDVVRELVVPALPLLVPEHPEVAEEARNRGHDAAEVADHGPAEADGPSGPEVDHADAERALADRLPGVAALEVAVVGDADGEPDQVRGDLAHREAEQPRHDADEDDVDEPGDEPPTEVGARAARPTR